MSEENREAGKQWITRAVADLTRADDLDVRAEWGPSWADAPARYRRGKPKPPTTALLVLTSGSRRKILWISEEELVACGAEPDRCDALTKKLKGAIEFLRSVPKARQQASGDPVNDHAT